MMKKILVTLLTLALLVGASFVLTVPASAEEATAGNAAAETVTWVPAEGDAVELKAGDSAEDGKVAYADGVLTLDGVSGKRVAWASGDLTIAVKGEVTVDYGANNRAIEKTSTEPGDLTITTAADAVLTLKSSQYTIYMLTGNLTFAGEGKVIVAPEIQRAIGLDDLTKTQDFVVNFQDSVDVSLSGTANIFYASAKTVKVNLSGSSKLTITASEANGYPFRLVSGLGSVVTLSDSAVLTQSVSSGWLTPSLDNGSLEFKAGEGFDLDIVSGESEATATPLESIPQPIKVNFLRVTAVEKPVDEDPPIVDPTDNSSTTSASDTASDTASASDNAASDNTGLIIGICVAAAVVVIVVVVAVVLSKKKKK